MKFSCSININSDLANVAKSFEDPEALKQTQKGFQRIEHLSGNKGESGAKSKLIYDKFELLETIIHNKLPDEFYAKYEHKNMNNTMLTKFVSINDHETKMITDIEYSQFKGFVINFMAKVFPGMFKKQVDNWLVNFKQFVEGQS